MRTALNSKHKTIMKHLLEKNNGIELLRALVETFDRRPEYLNEDKSAEKLIKEYKAYLKDEADLYGNKYEQ